MKIVIDMNLSPDWVQVFEKEGWTAKHWSQVGKATDPDAIIMNWAKANNYLVFTHDLDFGAILASTNAEAPSVIQVRTADVLPDTLGARLIEIITTYQTELDTGALMIVDDTKARIRILPLF